MAECTIYDKLRYISETKDLIKAAIESQDVEVLESDTFRKYAEYITEIRKVSSVNGMQGDVVITLEDLGGLTLDALNGYATEQWVEDKKYLTEHQSLENYYTKNDIDSKGYITAIPETYITEDELSTQLSDKVSETALNEALKGYYDKGEVDNLIDNVDVTEQLQNYYTKEEIEGKKYLTEIPSEYITEEELADTLDIITELGEDIASLEENKQDKLTQGTGIKIENNVISLDYSYDLFEVVTELPTENINENKIYLVKDTDGGEENAFVEYIYVNGKFEEVGKFKTTVDLTGYATEKWVSEQGFLTEVPLATTETDGLMSADDKEFIENAVFGFGAIKTEVFNNGTQMLITLPLNRKNKTQSKGYVELNSGTHFKTINGQPILGSGDITIENDTDLSNYYTKEEVDNIGYIKVIPDTYITEDELSAQLEDKVTEKDLNDAKNEIVKDVSDTIGGFTTRFEGELENKQDVLVSGTNIKTINNQTLLGEGNITIQGGSGGSVDLDLFEVVTELPTENIDENKIYLLQDPTAANKEVIVEGHMTPSTDYNWDGRDTYIQDGEATIDGTTINNDKRTRVTLRGFEGDTTIMLGLSFAPMDVIAEQLYIQLQHLNEDTSGGKPDTWNFREGGQVGEDVSWTTIGLGTLDPTQEYFFDVWTNGGQASVGGLDFYLPSYIAVPQSEKSGSQFIEYIYNNGEWEELGKNIKMVDPKAYRSISVDSNGVDGKSYAIFTKEDGSGDVLEVAKINGKTMIGWEAQEFSLAETKEVTQAEYDSMSKEDGVIYVITDAKEVGVPTKLSELEQDIEIGKTYTSGNGIKIENDTISLNTKTTVSPSSNYFTLWAKKDNGETGILVVNGSDSIKINYDNNNTYPVLSVSDKVALKSDLPDNDIYKSLYEYTYPYVNLVGVLPDKNKVIFASTYIDSGNESHTSTIESLYLKTINGVSLMGEGDISISGDGVVDLSSYYTKTEIDAIIGGVETKITEINGMI